jgi:transposase
MTKATWGRYTFEFKQEAARLVESDQSMAAAARSLGVVEQTLGIRQSASSKGAITQGRRFPVITGALNLRRFAN